MSIYSPVYVPLLFHSPLFSLSIQYAKSHTFIRMNLRTPIVNTRELPQTYEILTNVLPSILRSACFNEDNLPFRKEVYHTEIGHLFEHIMLEYLCQSKLTLGKTRATYSGETTWNWYEEERGTFRIVLSAGQKDQEVFKQALTKSITLLQGILQARENNFSYYSDSEALPTFSSPLALTTV